jgi:hypothetical protein
MEGSEICLEDAAARLVWNDVFGARRLPAQAALALPTVFGSLPIALLYAQGPGT